jgi:NADH:ubiquinone oxidoreductase subunit 3 (subunit A)
MSNWTNILAFIGVAVVVIALLLGLGNLLRGGDGQTSQKLMRWRVGLQFCAILLLLAILAFRHY